VELLGPDPVTSEPRNLTAAQLEVAVLDRARPRRRFRRFAGSALARLLGQDVEADAAERAGEPGVVGGRVPDEREVSPQTALAGGAHEPPGPDPAERERAGDDSDAGDGAGEGPPPDARRPDDQG
jgi:proteasome alpha subunit